MRAFVLILLLAGGAGLAWYLLQREPPPAPAVPAQAAAPSVAPVETSAPAAKASASPEPALPGAATPSWSPQQDALRQRAQAGDGSAAAQWWSTERSCQSLQNFQQRRNDDPLQAYFDAAEAARLKQAGPLLPAITHEEHWLLLDERLEAGQRRTLAQEITQRVRQLCQGYVAASAELRYAIAEIAARRGPDTAFWDFVDSPPLDEAVLRDAAAADLPAAARDWQQRVPALLQQRAERGNAPSVLALGMAYLLDGSTAPPRAMRNRAFLNASVKDDPQQAYRWLSLYLQMHPGSQDTDQAQQWLAELGPRLDDEQRAQAQRWVEQVRARQAETSGQN